MTVHEEMLQVLANYRDASAEEKSRADVHVAKCHSCAARFAAFQDVDVTLARLPQPGLPARLRQPLSALVAAGDIRSKGGARQKYYFVRMLAPAAVVLVLLVALSAMMWSVSGRRTAVTSTPTLTTTLTPTKVAARQTEPAVAGGPAHLPAVAVSLSGPVPTPAPAPEPVAGSSPVLLAGYTAHATMTH